MASPLKVAVAGAAGRMGKRLVAAVAEDPRAELCAAIEAPGHPDISKDAGANAGIGELGVQVTPDFEKALEGAGAVIDFTSPQASMSHLQTCAQKNVPAVIGTTGLSSEQKERAEELAQNVPCVLAPNMGTGVNLLFHLVERAAGILGPGFDIEVVESHHRMKKDAPSGTALRLAELAAKARGWTLEEAGRFSRHGATGERPDKEIGVQTVRAGDIVGEHTVIFAGPGERIEITHRAGSRDIFAKGAVRAALWVVDKRPGLYDMQDVLGLR